MKTAERPDESIDGRTGAVLSFRLAGAPALRSYFFPKVLPVVAATLILFSAAFARAAQPANTWEKVAPGVPSWRIGSVMLFEPGTGKVLHFGGYRKGNVNRSYAPAREVPYVQCFDPESSKWHTHSEAAPKWDIHPYYRAAYDPTGKKVYCLSQVRSRRAAHFLPNAQLYVFDPNAGTWKQHARDPILDEMNWHTMALDPVKRRLVVVGADKKPENVGWSRTAVYDLASRKWSLLPLPNAKTVSEHKSLVAATEALINLIGRTRLAWYRDPSGIGTDAERKALRAQGAALAKMPGMAKFSASLGAYDGLISGRKILDALKSARALQQKIEALSEEQYPVPPSRRNSPLVYNAKHRCMVLFGGDHEDYMVNDTWILDLDKTAWRRAKPGRAPSPRAGHALVSQPKSGKIIMVGGYTHKNNPDYDGYGPRSAELLPIQMWMFDTGKESWSLITHWTPDKTGAVPGYQGSFYGFRWDNFFPALLAVDNNDTLFHASATATWRMKIGPGVGSAVAAGKMSAAPNQRLYRKGMFRASFCETADPPPQTGLDKLPANTFVKLPKPPRNPCYGSRNRVWSTAAWDPDRDQILVWGGGHCVRSENPPIHYSPISGRMVEGYDAQESYTQCGAIGSTIMNRAWVSGHSWNMYAYDLKSKLLVTFGGYLYDPTRMDWLRSRPVKPPFSAGNSNFLESTPHGVVAWSAAGDRKYGLWLFDAKKGWTELVKPGTTIPRPGVDHTGLVYDGKRDRMLLVQNIFGKISGGNLMAFYFKDRRVEKLNPANSELGKIRRNREMVYVEHADWVLFGEPRPAGAWDGKPINAAKKGEKYYTRAYDCAQNKWMLLDIGGGFPTGATYCQGWMYDAKRKLVYVVNTSSWGAWALKLDPKSVRKLSKAP